MSYESNKKISDRAWLLKREIHKELDEIISNSAHMHYKRNFIYAGEIIASLATEMARVMKDYVPDKYD